MATKNSTEAAFRPAATRQVECVCGYFTDAELAEARNGGVVFVATCDGCGRLLRLEIAVKP